MTTRDFAIEVTGIFGRWIRKTLRRPAFLFFSLVQPIVWFVLFTQAFSSIAAIPTFPALTGTTSYITFFSAAVVIQTVIASSMQSGLGFVQDLESGFLDKLKVAPIHRSSILIGKVLSDGFRILLQTVIIMLLAFALGVGVATGIAGLLLLFAIAVSFGVAWSGISTFIALVTRNSEATLMISLLTTFPLLFLSTAMMPAKLLPAWVEQVSRVNPISYIADGIHWLVVGNVAVYGGWVSIGVAFLVVLAVGSLTLSATTAMFRRAVAG